MGSTESICPACGSKLGLPNNGSNIVCPVCGATHNPRGASPEQERALADDMPAALRAGTARPEGAEELLAELDERIDELASDIEALRSREQGAPLELGCALFGVFTGVILVLAFFATIARAYFGGWLFYLVLVIAILAGLYRIGPKIIGRAELPRLARKRAEMEATLSRLRNERERLERLGSVL